MNAPGIRFVAPIALLGVPTPDGRILSDPGGATIPQPGYLPIRTELAHPFFTEVGSVQNLVIVREGGRAVLEAWGSFPDVPPCGEYARLLATGAAFLSPEVNGEHVETYAGLRFDNWTLRELTLFVGIEGRPWNLPSVRVIWPPETPRKPPEQPGPPDPYRLGVERLLEQCDREEKTCGPRAYLTTGEIRMLLREAVGDRG